MLERIEYKDIKKYKRYIPFDINSRSCLYFDKDLIHKIPYRKEKGLDEILKYIDKLKLEELIEIKKLIYWNDYIIGYSMKNYKQYKSLRKFKNRKFDLKKNDCFKLMECFNTLTQYNLSYNDYHLGNFLLNPRNNDIKICDIDSLYFNKEKGLDDYNLKEILILILAYLYNVNDRDINNILNSSGVNLNNSFINNYVFFKNDISIKKVYEAIDKIQYNDTLEEKEYIINKSKQLSKLGYRKYIR